MSRVISRPRNQLHFLHAPRTRGEAEVLAFFDETLPEDREIYIQPHLNGARPDFVLLNPNVGIAVFEVKDCDLHAMERTGATKTNRRREVSGSGGGGSGLSFEGSSG